MSTFRGRKHNPPRAKLQGQLEMSKPGSSRGFTRLNADQNRERTGLLVVSSRLREGI
jgi:hypothetical protein